MNIWHIVDDPSTLYVARHWVSARDMARQHFGRDVPVAAVWKSEELTKATLVRRLDETGILFGRTAVCWDDEGEKALAEIMGLHRENLLKLFAEARTEKPKSNGAMNGAAGRSRRGRK